VKEAFNKTIVVNYC